jgi:hypothetical protein
MYISIRASHGIVSDQLERLSSLRDDRQMTFLGEGEGDDWPF